MHQSIACVLCLPSRIVHLVKTTAFRLRATSVLRSGKDDQHYVLDTARMMPPQPPRNYYLASFVPGEFSKDAKLCVGTRCRCKMSRNNSCP